VVDGHEDFLKINPLPLDETLSDEQCLVLGDGAMLIVLYLEYPFESD
jgi:hypothetical protein